MKNFISHQSTNVLTTDLNDFSVAIFAYLCDKFQLDQWYPKDLQKRARVNEYSHWQHFNIRANGAMVFRTKVRY